MNNPENSRREFLIDSSKFLATVALAPSAITILNACSEAEEAPPEIYSGALYGLEGKALISETRVDNLLRDLIDSGDPMLTKIGRNVKNLHYKNELASLPDIISTAAVPIPITRDYSDETSFAEIYAFNESDSEFLYGSEDNNDSYPYSESGIFGINIGVNKSFDSRDSIEESLFLAKEGLTALMFFRLSEEYQRNFSGDKDFRSIDGSIITDPDLLAKAGLKMATLDIRDIDSEFYKAVDLAPVFLMAPSIKYLVEERKISRDSNILGGFYIAANLVNSDPELGIVVDRLADWWVNSEGLTGPKGFTTELLDPKLMDAIEILHSHIYP